MLHLGMIGCGGIARLHAKYLRSMGDVKVVALFDPSAESIRLMNAELGAPARICESVEALLAHRPLDAVMVCTPTKFHPDAVIPALAAGVHVFCEKPIARTLADCDRMLAAARSARGTLTVGYVRRFDNEWNTMARIVREGRLGRPVVWRFGGGVAGVPAPWFCDDAIGGGPFLDGAVHNYDFAMETFGPVVRVMGVGQTWDSRNTAIDAGTLIVEFASGDQHWMQWTWALDAGGKIAAVRDVVGPLGGLQGGLGEAPPPAGFDPARQGAFVVHAGGKAETILYDRNDMYADQLAHWVGCLARGEAPKVTGEDGRRSLRVALAALEALRQHGSVEVAAD